MKTRIRIALLAFAALFALSACGNKGPLVLPPPPEPATVDDGGQSTTDAVDDAGDAEAGSDEAGDDPNDDGSR